MAQNMHQNKIGLQNEDFLKKRIKKEYDLKKEKSLKNKDNLLNEENPQKEVGLKNEDTPQKKKTISKFNVTLAIKLTTKMPTNYINEDILQSEDNIKMKIPK